MAKYKENLERIRRIMKDSGDQYLEFLVNQDEIERILQLQEEKNVLILGHNYMIPIVYQLSGRE
ncbi:hypothetical protein J4225_04660 [Candidatus Pacearchaeota archaeon]|nr:hypothetical protein [Candidatus Pacearchaeota archaeon]